MYQRDLGVPFVSFNTRTGHRSSAPEDCGRFVVTLPQGPVPVSGVFSGRCGSCTFWRLGLRQSSFRHITRIPRRAALDAWTRPPVSWACYFPLFTFRILGQPSDPETSPLVPARYAGDTTLRLVAQLQQPPATPRARPGRSPTTTPPADDKRDEHSPTARPARWTASRVSAGRVTCAAFLAPTGDGPCALDRALHPRHRSNLLR